MNTLALIGRSHPLFEADIKRQSQNLSAIVAESRFLVIGGAGSIGQAVTKELFRRNPRALHIVDLSENDMVELVRDIRSTLGYIEGDFRTFAIDCGSMEFNAMVSALGPYDFVFNLSALKHVRSEKDPFTLMRMIEVNIFNTIHTLNMARQSRAKNYFCVSTDKAANPVNMMGASKRIMEMFLMRESLSQRVSMARFANVAFSNGSLLHGFNQRIAKQQPISAPNDIKRYFITPEESGELCLLSALLGENRNIFFPKLDEDLHLLTFSEIAVRYLKAAGYEPWECSNEEEARANASELIKKRFWPCYFSASDTTGEKDYEEFFTEREDVDLGRFESIGVIRNPANFDGKALDAFTHRVAALRSRAKWSRNDLTELFHHVLPAFSHKETGKYLDQRM